MNFNHVLGKRSIQQIIAALLVITMIMPISITFIDVVSDDQISFALLESSDESEERNENTESAKKSEQKQSHEFILNLNNRGLGSSILHVPTGHNQCSFTHYLDVLTPPPDFKNLLG